MSSGETVNRSLFRADALRRYAASRETVVTPNFEEPRRFSLLWGVLTLLFVAAGLLFTIRVPVQTAGSTEPESRSVLSLLTGSSGEVSP